MIKTTAPISTKFCTVTKTNKYCSWVVQIHVKQEIRSVEHGICAIAEKIKLESRQLGIAKIFLNNTK